MVFSDTSTNQGLVQEIDFLLGTNSTTYGINDKTRNINRALERVASIIQTADGKWDWEDLNNTDMPIATTNIVAGQQDYSIDTTFLKIKSVFYTDANSSCEELRYSPNKEDYIELDSTDTGIPTSYTIVGNSILLDVYPTTSITSGLKVYFARDVHLFTVADTTATAGFASQFHRYLSLSAAYDFAIAKGKDIANTLRNEMLIMEKAIKEHYAMRMEVENRNVRVGGISPVNYL